MMHVCGRALGCLTIEEHEYAREAPFCHCEARSDAAIQLRAQARQKYARRTQSKRRTFLSAPAGARSWIALLRSQ
jgi:hypothetical protein